MIKIANEYMGIKTDGIRKLLAYYNGYVLPKVPKSRKYVIKMGDQWCMAFVSSIADKAGAIGFPWEVSTFYALKGLRERGEAFTNSHDAKEGDLIFFDWNGNGQPQHVGFVASNNDDYLVTIEGNKGGTVDSRIVSHTSKNILAFYRPKFK